MRFSVAKPFILVSFIALALFFSACQKNTATPPPAAESTAMSGVPKKMLWAWERPEDLRFLNSKEYGAAFLAQTITVSGSDVNIAFRRQPLEVNPDTFLMAVTRIETDKNSKPILALEQKEKIAKAVLRTMQLKNVSAVQIDFDVTVSERGFYRGLLSELRTQIPANIPFSITALASWCTADSWLAGLPVDEAVPMAFRMGADDASIRSFLGSGKDWQEPLCRRSYGFSIDEPFEKKLVSGRRIYFFNDRAWKKDDLNVIESFH
jgi:hypothetical protein